MVIVEYLHWMIFGIVLMSAYGVVVSIALNNGETLVQYYVPYLSAIQIFTSNPFSQLFQVLLFLKKIYGIAILLSY